MNEGCECLRQDKGATIRSVDRLARMLPHETVEHVDAAEVGQQEVEDGQVIRRSERRLEARVPVRRKINRKAFLAQAARDEIADAGLVIY